MRYFAIVRKNSGRMLLGVSLISILFYQNCSSNGGFDTVSDTIENMSSSCSEKMAAEQFARLAQNKEIDCTNLDRVVCDESVFSPDIKTQNQETSVCDVSEEIPGCLRLKRYYFNTAHAKDDSRGPSGFESGGAYNKTEIRCSLLNASGMALKIEQGPTIGEALHGLITKCTQRITSLEN